MRVQELAQRALVDLREAADGAIAAVVGADQKAAALLMARLAIEADMARARIEAVAGDVRAASRGQS